MKLKGKVALITGASSGIGKAIAERFAEEGASLALVARRAAPLRALSLALKPARTLAFPLDVSDEVAVGTLVEEATRRLGGLHILVNAAGGPLFKRLDSMSLTEWETLMAVHLRGLFLCCRAALPYLTRQGGDIVNISSAAALRGYPRSSAYSAAKAGVLGFSKALAAELKPRGVRVTALSLGSVDTPFFDRAPKPLPRDKMLRPEEVAELALFIVSQPRGVEIEELKALPGWR
ncbi:MAG: SDR family oxidoreductase [Nitrospinota bacterium]